MPRRPEHMSEQDVRRELAEIRRLLEGNPYNRKEEPGVLGRLDTIEHALWGPPDHPNGIFGMVREVRVTTRTMVVGVVITVVGVVMQQTVF
jgi:hypothetical protein